MAQNRLARTMDDRWLGGVCGGIARYLHMDSTMVRVLFVIISILSTAFPGLLVYIILWIFMPKARVGYDA